MFSGQGGGNSNKDNDDNVVEDDIDNNNNVDGDNKDMKTRRTRSMTHHKPSHG